MLANPQGTVIKFQQALKMDSTEQDGWIGSHTISTLLKKAGIPNDQIPADITAMTGKEKKSTSPAPAVVVAKPADATKPGQAKLNSLKAHAKLQQHKTTTKATSVPVTPPSVQSKLENNTTPDE